MVAAVQSSLFSHETQETIIIITAETCVAETGTF